MSKRLEEEREGCRGQDREPGKIGEGYRDRGFKGGRAGSQEKFARALGRRTKGGLGAGRNGWSPLGAGWGKSRQP